MSKIDVALVVPDCHHPYADDRAWNLLIDVGKALRPDRVNYLRVGKMNYSHCVDPRTCGPNAHRQARSSFDGNIVIGHTHRMADIYEGNARGRAKVGAMLGWLGDASKVDYMHRIKAKRDWQLGFGIVYTEPNGNAHLRKIPIVDYRIVTPIDPPTLFGSGSPVAKEKYFPDDASPEPEPKPTKPTDIKRKRRDK